MNAASHVLLQETAQRWRQFWADRADTLKTAGLEISVDDTSAFVTAGDGAARLFSCTDIPADIDIALTDLGVHP